MRQITSIFFVLFVILLLLLWFCVCHYKFHNTMRMFGFVATHCSQLTCPFTTSNLFFSFFVSSRIKKNVIFSYKMIFTKIYQVWFRVLLVQLWKFVWILIIIKTMLRNDVCHEKKWFFSLLLVMKTMCRKLGMCGF